MLDKFTNMPVWVKLALVVAILILIIVIINKLKPKEPTSEQVDSDVQTKLDTIKLTKAGDLLEPSKALTIAQSISGMKKMALVPFTYGINATADYNNKTGNKAMLELVNNLVNKNQLIQVSKLYKTEIGEPISVAFDALDTDHKKQLLTILNRLSK